MAKVVEVIGLAADLYREFPVQDRVLPSIAIIGDNLYMISSDAR